MVVAVDEGQEGAGELVEAAEVVGVTTFFWMTEKKIASGNPGALPRRGPLRTGRARLRAARLRQALMVRGRAGVLGCRCRCGVGNGRV